MSLSPNVRSNPTVLVKLYDAIQACHKSQQPSSLANILKALDVKSADFEREIRLAVEDGLLVVAGKDIFSIPHYEQSPILRHKHDSYCHNCHGSGQVLECETCWRVSHAACCPVSAPTTRGKFICSMCRQRRSAKGSTSLDAKQLNRLLIFIICILRERFKEHFLDPERLSNLVYRNLMFKFISFETIEEKIANNIYRTPLEFLCDIQTMFHCFVLANGTECSTTADLLYNYAHYELDELEICPSCYLLSNTKPENWFSIPCTPPHRLVYAKQKGYSYWPAKIVQSVKPHRDDTDFDMEGAENGDDDATSFDVRYFGGNHERAFIEIDCLKPIETDVQKLVPKRTVAFSKAMDELAIHQKYSADGPSKYAPIVDSLWNVTDWRGEIEAEKNRKNALISASINNGKAKRARGKSLAVTHRSSPTPTNSTLTGTMDGDSRDASISELIPDSPVPTIAAARVVDKDASVPVKTPASIRRSANAAVASDTAVVEPQIRQPASEKPVITKPVKENGAKASIRAAVPPGRVSLPSPTAAEVVAKKPLSPPMRSPRTEPVSVNAGPAILSPTTTNPSIKKLHTSQSNPAPILKQEKQDHPTRIPPALRTPLQMQVPPVAAAHNCTSKTEPLSPKPPTGPCGSGSLCAEAYDRKLAEAKREYEAKVKQLQEKLDAERRNEIAQVERRFTEEMAKLQKQQLDEIAAVKRKQWCVNCSQEAFFPCCWNTAYCSQHCQQEHWYHEHKKFCRRRRPQDSSLKDSSTTNPGGGAQPANNSATVTATASSIASPNGS